jgi:hypothetical protein
MNLSPHAAAQLADDRVAVADLLQLGFDRAVASTGLVRHTLAIGPTRVELRCAGPALATALLPALAHLARPNAHGQSDLTLQLWDSRSSGTPLPLLAATLIDQLRAQWWQRLGPRREVKALGDDRISALFHLGPDIFALIDRQRAIGFYWIEDVAAIPAYERGYPLTPLLNWWLESRGLLVVHAAAVGYPEAVALMPGKGGSGKSTTALACLDSDLGFLGDDYCALDPGLVPRLYSLYGTSKLKGPEDVERFQQHRSKLSNPDRLPDERALYFLHQHVPERLLGEGALRLILLPRVAGTRDTLIRPAGAAAALRQLAPSTMFQLPGDAVRAFRQAADLLRRLPIYEIALGTEMATIPPAIAALLNRHR